MSGARTGAAGRVDFAQLCKAAPDLAVSATQHGAEGWVLRTPAEELSSLMGWLAVEESLRPLRLVDLLTVDWLGAERALEGGGRRFELVYVLQAESTGQRFQVSSLLPDPVALADEESGEEASVVSLPRVDSVTKFWPSAIWLEREVFDLFGIEFSGHPGLKRILLGADFVGAPLRKDFE